MTVPPPEPLRQAHRPLRTRRLWLGACVLALLQAGLLGADVPTTPAPSPAHATTPMGPPRASAPADPEQAAVAVVDGVTITLRQVEDALLKKEGSDGLTDWVQGHLAKLDWSKIKDSDVILAIGDTSLTRKDLVLHILKPTASSGGFGAKTREDLINACLVQSALAKGRLVLDQAALDGAWKSLESQFYASQKDSKDRVEFASYIRTKEGMDEEEYRRQPGFLMQAGLRKLAIQHGMESVVEADVQAWFESHRQQWDVQPAVRLADIFMPYQKQNDDERVRVMTMALSNYQGISSKAEDFAQVWTWLGKVWDPDAAEGGDIGWVTPDGTRAVASARKLPQAVMDQAFQAKQVPVLLQPVASEKGIDLVRVEARRAGLAAVYQDVRGAVLMDMLDTQLQNRMVKVLTELRQNAKIEYRSLPDAIDRLAGP